MNNRKILLLDSNVSMYLLNADISALELLDGETTALSFVSEIELLGWPSITAKEKKIIEAFIEASYYYDYSTAIKDIAIQLRIQYRLKLGDSLIAATALNYDLTLVSADKVFLKVKGLRLINFIPTISK